MKRLQFENLFRLVLVRGVLSLKNALADIKILNHSLKSVL